MIKKCIGCGAILQNENEAKIGYVKDLNKDYCMRCFKLIHYDIHVNNIEIPDNEQIIKDLKSLEGQFVWVIDIFDLDSSLNSVLVDFFKEKQCLVIFNKCDLLPDDINYEKLADYLMKRLSRLEINYKAVITRGVNNDFVDTFDNFIDANYPIIITGLANVGKSTIINQLLNKELVTVNRFPATTINVNEIVDDNYHIFDTVGIINKTGVQLYLENTDLRNVIPQNKLKPMVFQIDSDQSFAIGGLARIDVKNVKKATVIIYCSSLLDIHRCKLSNADNFWQNHFNELAKPVLIDSKLENFKRVHFANKNKTEYFIYGLGFVSVIGNNLDVDCYIDSRIRVDSRKAMI